MDPQWQNYADSPGASRRHNGTGQHQQSMSPRDFAPQSQHHPQQSAPPTGAPGAYKYDHYAGASAGGAAPPSAPGANSMASPMSGSHLRDGNGDVAMYDAHDAHAGMKYPLRPHHQSHPSSSGRSSNVHSPQESSAAQRYSPMDTLSPSSPYAPRPPQFGNPPAQRQSPVKQGDYGQNSYYQSRQQGQQLPPITPYASSQDGYPSSAVANLEGGSFNDPKSPRRQAVPAQRGPVPEFRNIRGTTDLRPKISHQPPFRRANPEGGFISVGLPAPCVVRNLTRNSLSKL